MNAGTPVAERLIDEVIVRQLLCEQHPHLADASLVLLDAGWDNVMYRLGEKLVVRLPRRSEAVALIEHEQTWLPTLAPTLPLPIPVPIHIGRASPHYPWPWSIVPWLRGKTADQEMPASHQALPLAEFLLALHQPAPDNAPLNPVRGVPLRHRASVVAQRLHRLQAATDLISPEILTQWQLALAAPEAQESRWLHGDLHARNVLVEAGVITGIIDWGDLTSGDVATDLASVWMLLDDAQARIESITRYRPNDAVLARAKGWAVVFGAALLDTGLVDHPAHAALGRLIFQRLAEDA